MSAKTAFNIWLTITYAGVAFLFGFVGYHVAKYADVQHQVQTQDKVAAAVVDQVAIRYFADTICEVHKGIRQVYQGHWNGNGWHLAVSCNDGYQTEKTYE